ncbi:MAG: haloacid dehalogenase-like hydrolase [Candidatus Treponema excrementipullorum]|uniref:Haloacid dehalogenase-like hydrolase n=1 Tax=Candidatus Treponema excrementipullorum TaxID=2838768 RepID=A0A9E2L147_9SPIR|nr:haloacid dehalogenase-like hydrolase [Candidatus Treponema excrementipullorum]
MSKKEYIRKCKEENPVVAICYDFDKTLTPDDMQAQGYIQSVGYDVADFWQKSNGIAEENDMDQNLAYMYTMKEESEGKILFTKEKLAEYGSKVQLFPGVEQWFERIREYGKEKKVIVEHYIISSGLKEMIEGTSVAKNGAFEKIYASSFYYNKKEVAVWPAQVVNYTNKTQFLFRIEKGVLDINDPGVNESFSPEEMRVPFRNMIYIGDSDTDIPCMKLVNSYGGHSIGVYNAESKDKTKVYKMMRDGRIKYFVPADYTENSELDILIKNIIDRTATNEVLETLHYQYKNEQINADKNVNESERKKSDLLIALENSDTFKRTHSVISDLKKIDDWTMEEQIRLIKIALDNSQIRYLLGDYDVKRFYENLLDNMENETSEIENLKTELLHEIKKKKRFS